jgi:hypothetical protein
MSLLEGNLRVAPLVVLSSVRNLPRYLQDYILHLAEGSTLYNCFCTYTRHFAPSVGSQKIYAWSSPFCLSSWVKTADHSGVTDNGSGTAALAAGACWRVGLMLEMLVASTIRTAGWIAATWLK